MENVVLSFECKRRLCLEHHLQITQCGIRIGAWIITHGGPIFDHLLQAHPGEKTFSLFKGAKFRPFSNYGISPSLLIKHDKFYEEQPLNVAYVYRDEKLMCILHKIMIDSVGVNLQTGDLRTGDVKQKIIALSHYIYLRCEREKEIFISKKLFVQNLSFGQQIVAISTPFSAISLHNSWSEGTICNIISEYVALTDLKLTLGSEGAPVFSLNNGKVGSLVGLILGNLTYRNGDLTGLNFLALPSSFMNSLLPIFTSCVPFISYTPSNIQELEGQQSVVQIFTNRGWGSGTVITKDGLILTCAHIVHYGKARDIFVETRKKLYTARVIFSTSYGHTCELAVLEITDAYSDNSLIPVRCRNNEVILGEEVYTVGYCLFDRLVNPTVTRGLVSKLTKHCIITTCFVHNGTSGGPLLDKNGELLGIIVSNVKTSKFVYSNVNVNIAIYSFRRSIENFILTRDSQILENWSTSVPADAATIKFSSVPNKL